MTKRKYKNGDVITLTIDRVILEEYNKYYFAKYQPVTYFRYSSLVPF